MSKVTQEGATFQPGDWILFKRGEVYRTQTEVATYDNSVLLIVSAGTEDLPIKYGAYGPGSKPVLSTAYDTVAEGWSWVESSSGNNEYYLNTGSQIISEKEVGTYYEWRLHQSDGTSFHRGTCVTEPTIHCGDKLAACDNSGCQPGVVGSFLLDGQFGYGDNDGLGYGTIYIRSDSGNPHSRWNSIYIPQVESVVRLSGANHIIIEELIMEHATAMVLNIYCGGLICEGFNIRNNEFRYSGGPGVKYAAPYIKYYNSKIRFTGNDVHHNAGDGVGFTGADHSNPADILQGTGLFMDGNTLHDNYGDGLGMFYWHGMPSYCADGTTGCDLDDECIGIGDGTCETPAGSTRDEVSNNNAYDNGGMGSGGLGGGAGFNFDGSNANTDCVCAGDVQVREGGSPCDRTGTHSNTPSIACNAKGNGVDCGALACNLDGSEHNIGPGVRAMNIHHNTAYGNAHAGILYEFYADNSIIHHNLVYDNQHSGFTAAIAASHSAYDNLFYFNVIGSVNIGNGMGAFYMGDEKYDVGNWFLHNTIDMDDGSGNPMILYSSKDTVIKNNVYVRNPTSWVTYSVRYIHEDLSGNEDFDYNVWSTQSYRIAFGINDGLCSDDITACKRDSDCSGGDKCFWWLEGGYNPNVYNFDEMQSELGFEEHGVTLVKGVDYTFTDESSYDYTPVGITPSDWEGANTVQAAALAKFGVDIYADGDFLGRPINTNNPTKGAFQYSP